MEATKIVSWQINPNHFGPWAVLIENGQTGYCRIEAFVTTENGFAGLICGNAKPHDFALANLQKSFAGYVSFLPPTGKDANNGF